MPKRYNIDHQPAVLTWTEPAILPGESYDFTDEQIAAGLGGSWSETDPREGLDSEQVFKRARDRSRSDLDDEARSFGIDTTDLQTKQDVAEAIKAALDAQAQIQDVQTDPAEPGQTKE